MLLGAAVEGLAWDARGHVEGVRVVSGGESWTEEADAVILASGGFAANPELVGRHIVKGAGRMRLRAHPWSTGDGFLAALAAGRLFPERLQVFVGPDVAARVDERPAEPVAFLKERNAGAQLERPPGRDQPGEAAADDGDAHPGS